MGDRDDLLMKVDSIPKGDENKLLIIIDKMDIRKVTWLGYYGTPVRVDFGMINWGNGTTVPLDDVLAVCDDGGGVATSDVRLHRLL